MRVALAREAERACVDAGAAPQTVRVETFFEARDGLLRAVATGAVALESGAASREPVDEPAQLRAAAGALGMAEDGLQVVARNDFYRVFCENGAGAVAVVDGLGSVALAENAKRVIADDPAALLERLTAAVDDGAVNLGVATLLPRVAIVCGAAPRRPLRRAPRRGHRLGRPRRARRPRRDRRRRDLVVT